MILGVGEGFLIKDLKYVKLAFACQLMMPLSYFPPAFLKEAQAIVTGFPLLHTFFTTPLCNVGEALGPRVKAPGYYMSAMI